MKTDKVTVDEVIIDGAKFVRSDSVQRPSGTRHVVVVDRGWIFAGDLQRKDGRIVLTRAVWPMSWAGIGFDGLLANPKSSNVKLRKLDHIVEIPVASEIFSIPVAGDWGM